MAHDSKCLFFVKKMELKIMNMINFNCWIMTSLPIGRNILEN